MKKLYLFTFCLFVFSANAQIINFPDPNFKAKLMQPFVAYDSNYQDLTIDANGDGDIEVSEAQAVLGLNVSNGNISDLTGISNFTNLKYLGCDNNLLTSLQIDNSIILESLSASHNLLTSFNASFDVLYGAALDLSYNSLTTLTVPPGHFEDNCDLSHNQLTEVTFSNNTLWYLNLSYNNLTQINGSCDVYKSLSVAHNQFSSLDLSNFTFGYESTLYMGYNVADVISSVSGVGNIYYSSDKTFADFGNFNAIGSCEPEMRGSISITNCPNLEYFSLKNGYNHTFYTCNEGGNIFDNPALSMSISNCPSLSFICVDEGEKPYIQNRINSLGLQNQVQVNSYCTFTPGGNYYTVNGITTFDNDNDGCDASDTIVPFQQFTVTNGTQSGINVAGLSGNHAIYVGAGTNTITPVNPNPAIFTISPASVNIGFPASASPYLQNFCVSSSGVHPDLEILLLPLGLAAPGFDANYKLTFKNKGNQIQSGTVNLTFNDAVLDFISANTPTTTQSANALTWDFSNLQPFETRAITFVMNLNTPIETPPLNANDVLAYNASLTTAQTDDTPADNTAILNQTVVNSFDPNDKTCLEGNTVGPEMIGQYVHYKIRFENTGSAAAKNIVVKDNIDTTKFDVASLIPLDGSHQFVTRITNTNTVEFIFENINLPFDDANNDGYVAFKIKTNPTLVLGDTFSNSASIYFDYNFPIVTDAATTLVQLLGNPDFEFSQYFTLYPNPVKNALNIKMKSDVTLKSVSIYNMLGQLIQVTGNPESIDVSGLTSGNYIVKVTSDKGMTTTKFIKE